MRNSILYKDIYHVYGLSIALDIQFIHIWIEWIKFRTELCLVACVDFRAFSFDQIVW